MYTTTVWVVIAGWVFSQEPPVFKLYATAANIEDSPKRYLDREVHLSGADLYPAWPERRPLFQLACKLE